MTKCLLNQITFLKYLMFVIGTLSFMTISAQNIRKVVSKVDDFKMVEAEKFDNQTLDSKRSWHLVSTNKTPKVRKDKDPNHSKGASGLTYLELLPDSLYDDNEKKVDGKNFSRSPGKMAVLSYDVNFNTSGKYYVWIRGYATNGYDNSIHVGIDGKWPESSQKMYICDKKMNKWSWTSKQFINDENCRSTKRIFFNIKKPGTHKVMFSMREDGFEFDKFAITKQAQKMPQ